MDYNYFALYLASAGYAALCLASIVIGGHYMSDSPGWSMWESMGWPGLVQLLALALLPVVNTLLIVIAVFGLLFYYKAYAIKWWYWVFLAIGSAIMYSLYYAAF